MLIFHRVVHAAERPTDRFKSPLMQCSSGEAPGNNPTWLVPNGCRIQRVQVEATLHFPGRADQRQTLVKESEVIPEKQAGVEQKTEKTRQVWACSSWDYVCQAGRGQATCGGMRARLCGEFTQGSSKWPLGQMSTGIVTQKGVKVKASAVLSMGVGSCPLEQGREQALRRVGESQGESCRNRGDHVYVGVTRAQGTGLHVCTGTGFWKETGLPRGSLGE